MLAGYYKILSPLISYNVNFKGRRTFTRLMLALHKSLSTVFSYTVTAIEIGVWEFLGASKGNIRIGTLVW